MNNARAKSMIYLLMGTLVLCICFTDVQAAMLDLTAGGSGTLNGAYYEWMNAQATGTGVIDPFVRVSANTDEERGYNTSNRKPTYPLEFDENSSGQFTHSLTFSNVPIVNLNGTDYRQFLLDINQNGSSDQHPTDSFLSLYTIRVYLSDDAYIWGYDTSLPDDWSKNDNPVSLVYDLDVGPDSDSYIDLNYDLNHGSGSGDMWAYIPDSLFMVDDSNPSLGYLGDYLTLYSEFGNPYPNNDGFEEWAVIGEGENPPVVPLPPSVIIGLIGMCVAGVKLRKFA